MEGLGGRSCHPRAFRRGFLRFAGGAAHRRDFLRLAGGASGGIARAADAAEGLAVGSEEAVLDASSLAEVRMPNRDGFTADARLDVPAKGRQARPDP